MHGLEQERDLAAMHSRHDHIGDKQVDRSRVGLRQPQRLVAPRGGEDRVTASLEHAPGESEDLFLVLDQ